MALKLRTERLRRGLTQTALSALTAIAQSDLSAIENGHRRAGAGQRRRIALVFGLPEQHLFAVEDIATETDAKPIQLTGKTSAFSRPTEPA